MPKTKTKNTNTSQITEIFVQKVGFYQGVKNIGDFLVQINARVNDKDILGSNNYTSHRQAFLGDHPVSSLLHEVSPSTNFHYQKAEVF